VDIEELARELDYTKTRLGELLRLKARRRLSQDEYRTLTVLNTKHDQLKARIESIRRSEQGLTNRSYYHIRTPGQLNKSHARAAGPVVTKPIPDAFD